MQAIILAAGAGNRLAEVSNGMPKSMLRIGEKSIIQNQIEQCLELGVERFIFVIGYEKERLREHILRYLPDKEIFFYENMRYEDTNTLYSLYLVRENFTKDFLYFNGDVFFRERLLRHLDLNSENTQLLLKTGKCEKEEVKMIISDNGKILEIGKDLPEEQCAGEFIGIGYFARNDLELFSELLELSIAEGQENNYFEYAVNKMCSQSDIYAVVTGEDECLEIDFPEDLKKARELFG